MVFFLKDVLDSKNSAIKDLQYELARVCKVNISSFFCFLLPGLRTPEDVIKQSHLVWRFYVGETLPNNQMVQYDCDVTSDMIGLDDTNGTYCNSGCTFCH